MCEYIISQISMYLFIDSQFVVNEFTVFIEYKVMPVYMFSLLLAYILCSNSSCMICQGHHTLL